MSASQVALVRAVSDAIIAHLDDAAPELPADIGVIGCLDAAVRITRFVSGLSTVPAIDRLLETMHLIRATEVAAAAEQPPEDSVPAEHAPPLVFRYTLAELADIVHAHVQASGGLPDISTVFAELRLTSDGIEYSCQVLPNVTVLKPKGSGTPK